MLPVVTHKLLKCMNRLYSFPYLQKSDTFGFLCIAQISVLKGRNEKKRVESILFSFNCVFFNEGMQRSGLLSYCCGNK